jgi:hypothetical protein
MCDQVLSEDIPIDLHVGHGKHKRHFQRKDAKNAEKIFNENNLILCTLSAIDPCIA